MTKTDTNVKHKKDKTKRKEGGTEALTSKLQRVNPERYKNLHTMVVFI